MALQTHDGSFEGVPEQNADAEGHGQHDGRCLVFGHGTELLGHDIRHPIVDQIKPLADAANIVWRAAVPLLQTHALAAGTYHGNVTADFAKAPLQFVRCNKGFFSCGS
ncbi:MAG TPA: hypothetical protein VJ750_04465 [Rhizomicrobium sp.]|nr:hypothetical protein [Rhizomicrobium sp.]